MPGVVAGIHDFEVAAMQNVDRRDKPGYDEILSVERKSYVTRTGRIMKAGTWSPMPGTLPRGSEAGLRSAWPFGF